MGFISSRAQTIEIETTRNIYDIAKNHGIDSSLELLSYTPIHELDSFVARRLLDFALKSSPSFNTDGYIRRAYLFGLIHLSDSTNVRKYYEKKLHLYSNKIPILYTYPAVVEDSELLLQIEYCSNSVENSFKSWYRLWLQYSSKHYADYKAGISVSDNLKKEQLQTFFKKCHSNCAKYLLALKTIDSPWYSWAKLDSHNHFLNSYEVHSEKSELYISNYEKDFNYNGIPMDTISLNLSDSYQAVSEINFSKEREFKSFVKKFSNKNYHAYFLCNGRSAYFSISSVINSSCSRGSYYKISLINGTQLVLYRMNTWIS